MMLSFLNVVAGISWEPEIRGALVFLVGSAVLFGSVWLILSTNIGSRLGTLNALAGLFAWMAIMGLVWWIYGGNVLSGDAPSWVPKEMVFGELDQAGSGDVADLADAELIAAPALVEATCPGLVAATEELQRARVVEGNVDLALSEFYTPPADKPYCASEQVGELLAVDELTLAENITAANEALGPDDPRYLTEPELAEAIDTAIDDQRRKVSQLTLGALLAASPEIVDAVVSAGDLDFEGWTLVSSADAGEAQATASAFLVSNPDSPYGDAGDFLVLETYQQGGKPERSSDGVVDRVWNEVRNTVVFWHPTNTVVVQTQAALEKDQIPGQAPPFAELDTEAQTVSVVMVRDLGSRRLPAAYITIGSLLIFLALCWMLHARDLELRRRLAEWDPAAAA
ncbi:MAG: hypothetical protein ACR2N9_04535 [Acidimicrobiia bacterium]